MTETATSVAVEPITDVPRRRRWIVGTVVWLATAPFLIWAGVRLFGLERGFPMVQLTAFTPYVAAVSLLPVVIAAVARRWRAVAVGSLAMVVLAACVLPRWFASSSLDAEGGSPVRVMAANLLGGNADERFLVDLVRAGEVDIVAFQEYTLEAEESLQAAGLAGLLPHRVAYPAPGVEGSAVWSRFPLRDGALRVNPGGFRQARATVDVPGGRALIVESVHPLAPWSAWTTQLWKKGLLRQQPATVDGPLRVLAGDFNATLDHAALRDLLDTGYRDAASLAGEGLTPTWPYHPPEGKGIPPVTLDHIFADERIGVRAFTATTVPGSDHRAILTTLTLP